MCYPSRETSIDEFLMEMVDMLNSNDRSARSMQDPDWLEVVGNPTIPHVQSLRQPPASVALPVSNERLIGVTNRNASRRYLRKLQKDRERNQEVLSECVGNLPIVIRQLAYPEGPPNKSSSARTGIGNAVHSADKKFRIGRFRDEFWQENAEKWTSDEIEKEDSGSPRPSRRTGSSENGRQNGGQTDDESEFVHHAGFVGVPNQTSTLKYRFGKKKPKLAVSESADSQATRSTFRPKGFGALYDELEFERRYKKVFDLNKHIHFVHSNFVSGQRISKRAKLPPIGHNPSVFSDPMDGGDIFAIMSVQKYNYPEELESPRNTMYNTSTNGNLKSDGSPKRLHMKRSVHVEIPRVVDVPIGFVPGSIPKTGQTPFDGVRGVMNLEQTENQFRLPSWIREADSAVGTGIEEREEIPKTDRSSRSNPSRNKPKEENKTRLVRKKRVLKSKPEMAVENKSDEEGEPFNISVHVELKPRDTSSHVADDNHARHRVVYNGILESPRKEHSSDESPRRDKGLTPRSSDESPRRDKGLTPRKEKKDKKRSKKYYDSDSETFEEQVLYPTRLPSREIESEQDLSDLEPTDHVIWPKNITTTTSQYGLSSQKVKYPDRFTVDEALEEEDEVGVESCTSPVKMADGPNKVPKLFADTVPQSEAQEQAKPE